MVKRLYFAGLVTLIGFPLLGWFILRWFMAEPVAVMTRSSAPLWQQMIVGIIVGLAAGGGAWWVVRRPFMRSIEKKYSVMIHRLRLSVPAIVFLSICAGFGEELLFRGAVQPLLGIWLTALIFVAIHGYLNPMQWKISVYGLYMTVVIAVLGYLVEWQGIWAACIAHTLIDIVLFRYLVQRGRHLSSSYQTTHEIS